MRKFTRVFLAGGQEPVVVAMEFDAWVRTWRDALGLGGGEKAPAILVEAAGGSPVMIALDAITHAEGFED